MSNLFDMVADGEFADEEVLTEAVSIQTLPYLKTIKRRYDLPHGEPLGYGNACFLYTNSFDDSLKIMTQSVNMLARNRYKLYYYNPTYIGSLYNKKYRFRNIKERDERYKKVRAKTNITPVKNSSFFSKAYNKNTYIDLSTYVNIFTSYDFNLSQKRYLELYWNYMETVVNFMDLSMYNYTFMIINLDQFSFGKTWKETKNNPIYMIYYALMRSPKLLEKVNMDIYFYTGLSILKVNPAKLVKDLKPNEMMKARKSFIIEMRRVIGRIQSGEEFAQAINVADAKVDDANAGVEREVKDLLEPVNQHIDVVKPNEEVKEEPDVVNFVSTDEPIPSVNKTHIMKATSKPVETPKKNETISKEDLTAAVKAAQNKAIETIAKSSLDRGPTQEEIDKQTIDEINRDRELIEKLYNQTKSTMPKKSVASTARDKLLREKQKEIDVAGMTIQEIQRLKSKNIPVPVTDVSNALTTSNDNMKTIRYHNMDKAYNEKLMKADIINAFTALNDKSIPMFILSVDIEDTSDELNYKDTYTIKLEDGNRKRHTIKVDIPKFVDDKFLYIGGNKKILKNQNIYFPVVKLKEDTVQIVSNYSKMIIERVNNKSISAVERLKKLIRGSENVSKFFVMGAAFPNNKDAITTLEYDDLSKFITKFSANHTTLFFDSLEAEEFRVKRGYKDKRPEKLFIGEFNSKPCYIDIDTQVDDSGYGIVEMIVQNIPEEEAHRFASTSSPKSSIYAKVRVMDQNVYVGMLLGLWEGISTIMKKLNVEWRLEEKVPKNIKTYEDFIRFSDCVLVYKQTVPNALIMNGFKMFKTIDYTFDSFDGREPYLDYIKAKYGTAIIENALMNFYEFFIDSVTLEILKDQNLPQDIVSLFCYAINLIADSQCVPDINQNLSRIRRGEIIPGILYDVLAKSYINFRTSNGRKSYNIKRDAVITKIMGLKTLEDYSVLNPSLELQQTHAISTKGFHGVNLDDAYSVPKRSYDPSMVGIIAPSTSPDGQCGISRYLSMEPNITNLRGYTLDKHEKLDELKDVNIFSPSELSLPIANGIDDPMRLGHSQKQSSHVIPVTHSSPVLITNGLDEAARFHLSKDFVINAAEDGEIVDYDKKSNILIAKYKSGKTQAINLEPNIVKNSGGGFYLSNKLITELKVGDKFKKNSVLAYHKDYFKNSKYNNCRMNIGTLSKVALMSTYNTYEDSTFITEKLSERASTEMVFCKSAVVGKNANVFYIAKKGQHVSVGDPLIQFDTSYEDESINSLLGALSDEDKESILSNAKNNVLSKFSGVIESIKIYPTIETDEMSPSLQGIVKSYYSNINHKKRFLEKYDPASKGSIVKCGTLVTDINHKIEPNKFGVIRGEKVEDGVLIEFYIKHAEPLEIGSKVAMFSALKNTISEIIPKGYEPYSEYRPDEEISSIIATNSILNRMVPSILITALANKCIIELKRSLKTMNMNRKKMEELIYSFFHAFDKSGVNEKTYRNLFEPMSDAQFKKYFMGFFADDDAYLTLTIVDYERTIHIEDVERAAKVINCPLFEYVYLPHISMDKKRVTVTKEKVPVGYVNIKRTQQTVAKKNGMSTDISQRSALVNQVTGKDKNGRSSDLENIMLKALGLNNVIKELNAPRADDSVMKNEMLRDIALNGYTRLEDMTDEIKNKTTLNTVNAYILGMSLKSDLVSSGLMLPKTMKEEMKR